MSEEGENERRDPSAGEDGDSIVDEASLDREDDPVRALLRGAAKDEPAPVDLLPAVQKKLRVRSRGKFYGDGWSTAQQTTSYLLVALVMLLVIGAAYYVLGSVR